MNREANDVSIQFVKSQVSVWSLGAIAVGLCGQFFALGVAYSTLRADITDLQSFRTERKPQVDAKIAGIEAKIAPLETIVFRLTAMETTVKLNNEAINSRADRIVDSLGGKIDAAITATNDLRSDVKLLSQKVDANIAQKKAELLDSTPPSLARANN